MATTSGATEVTISGATLNGTVTTTSGEAQAWFQYGSDPSFNSFAETTFQPIGPGATDQPVNATLTTLASWKTFYFRIVAENLSNPGVLSMGEIRSFPTGEYYVAVGDSITAGSQDDISSDGIGYEPILEDLLTQWKGYPHTVENEGFSGDTSADGAASISTVLSRHPAANFFLIQYGSNDAFFPPVSKADFKANIQSIITAVKNAGKTPFLAKVPYTDDSFRSIPSIQEYNDAIDELVLSNGIPVTPPDFYSWFLNHPGELDDGVHPNGRGYQSMANLWFLELTEP